MVAKSSEEIIISVYGKGGHMMNNKDFINSLTIGNVPEMRTVTNTNGKYEDIKILLTVTFTFIIISFAFFLIII